MAETPKIVLDNRSLWMSPDEYAGGSYYYWEWINSYSDSKSFKLGSYLLDTELNSRYMWYPISLIFWRWIWEQNYSFNWMIWFTADWYIETDWFYRWSSSNLTYWWAIYKRNDWGYLNWFVLWDYIYGVSRSKIDKILLSTSLIWTNIVLNPWLTSNSWRTVWSWRTTWASWATHTSWTENLRQVVSLTNAWKYRISVRISWVTDGSCEVRLWWDSIWTITPTTDVWFMGVGVAESTSEYINFIPSTTFNWTIWYVKVQKYDDTKLLTDNISITEADRHPVCIRQWYIYIWWWSKLDVVSLLDWDVTQKSIIDDDYTIVDITQQWWSLILRATDWINSKQFYWNWVDDVSSEVIYRPWNSITGAISDETKSYVSVSNNYDRRIYIVSWYQRQLIASSVFNWRSIERLRSTYHKNKKFNFYVSNVNQMAILNDRLYVKSYWWTYMYWNDIIWQPKWRSKPITIWASEYTYCYQTMYARLYMSINKNWKNYISSAREYNYTPRWYLVTNTILWDKLSSRKSISKIRLWYKNVSSSYWNIKIYAIIDDDFFWRYNVLDVTTRPEVWDTYNVWTFVVWEVIAVENNWTTWTITFKTISNTASYPWWILSSLTKITWNWQAAISTNNIYDNMCLIKTITSDEQVYWDDIIFSTDFINAHIPFWRKLQLVIELNSNYEKISPEIYDISILSDITGVNV